MYALIGVVKPLYVFFQLRKSDGCCLSGKSQCAGNDCQPETKLVFEEKLDSSKFANFDEALKTFLSREDLGLKGNENTLVYLSLAGPVVDQNCALSFLEWRVDSAELKKEYGFREVYISNDAKSTCEGVLELFKRKTHKTFSKISLSGEPKPNSVSILVELHTGLGICMIIPVQDERKVFSGEGGHTDYLAVDPIEWDLKTFIQKNFSMERVETENVVSGMGIDTIYCFLSSRHPDLINPEISEKIKASHLPGHLVCEFAKTNKDPLCVKTLDLFIRILNKHLCNTALKFLPYGGIFIVGEFIPTIAESLKNGGLNDVLMENEKANVLSKIPIFVQKEPEDFELMGALMYTEQRIREIKKSCRRKTMVIGVSVLLSLAILITTFGVGRKFNKRK